MINRCGCGAVLTSEHIKSCERFKMITKESTEDNICYYCGVYNGNHSTNCKAYTSDDSGFATGENCPGCGGMRTGFGYDHSKGCLTPRVKITTKSPDIGTDLPEYYKNNPAKSLDTEYTVIFKETKQGWQCPLCKVVYSPDIDSCNCQNET